MNEDARQQHGISYSKRQAGWLLAHNIVRPDVDQRHGWKGFRRFWVPPEKKERLAALQVRLAAGPRAALQRARRVKLHGAGPRLMARAR